MNQTLIIDPRYITIKERNFPKCALNSEESIHWWVSHHIAEIIDILEKENPKYEFVQIVTSPGHGGHSTYIIMKLKI